MEREIGKRYEKLAFMLALISSCVATITTFVPTFYVNLGFLGAYADNLWTFILGGIDNLIKTIGGQPIFNTKPVVEMKLDPYGFVYMALVLIFVFLLFNVRLLLFARRGEYHSRSFTSQIVGMLFFVKLNIFFTLMFFAIVLYNFFVLEHKAGLHTFLYIPLIIQIALLIIGLYFKGHYKKARKGEVNPVNLFASFDEKFAESTKKNAELNANAKGEKNKIELIAKYKELLDSGAITQEEFDRKKKELLDD